MVLFDYVIQNYTMVVSKVYTEMSNKERWENGCVFYHIC